MLWFEQSELRWGSGVKKDRKYTEVPLLCALIHSDSYKKAFYGSSHITSQHEACHHGETHHAMIWKWQLLLNLQGDEQKGKGKKTQKRQKRLQLWLMSFPGRAKTSER